jgi:23S rRNA (guanosine2251-2'-O)-methyltransferase
MSLLYGINPVLETLKADSGSIERVCVQKDQRNPRIREIVELSRKMHLPLSFEERAWLDRKTGRERHQGVLCYVAEARTFDAPEIIDSAKAPGLLVVLDGIEDPHNVGAILRSAEVAGADGVFLPQRRSAGLGPTAVKSSAGAASHLKIGRVPNVARLVDLMKERGYWIAGLDAQSDRNIWEADFLVSTALILGSEGGGLHRLVKEKCDFLLSIPVRGKISSHNVSVAAGIALYEVIRQRSISGG